MFFRVDFGVQWPPATMLLDKAINLFGVHVLWRIFCCLIPIKCSARRRHRSFQLMESAIIEPIKTMHAVRAFSVVLLIDLKLYAYHVKLLRSKSECPLTTAARIVCVRRPLWLFCCPLSSALRSPRAQYEINV